ncbi:hypothetical protein [Rhodococcus sp. UFZ-B548]|uniref:hypothetical protein n=1 Tax=Rhodococcus sp. UFZ-B548 TaxID=2742212 RepID=UPI0015F5C655|nr:hypothetical protein [Rhodococcus sp. UFZ-B548]
MTTIFTQTYMSASDPDGVELFSLEPLWDVIRDHALWLLVIAVAVALWGHAKVQGWFGLRASMGVGGTAVIAAAVFAVGVLAVWW